MPDSVQKVRELIKSKTPFIYIVSDEERRICEEIIQNIAKPLNREVWIWTSNSGLINFETREDKKCKRIEEAVKEIVDMKVSEKKSGAIFLLLDPHVHINPSSARIMKDGYVNIMLGKHKDMIDNPKAYEGKVGSPKNIIFVAGRLAHVSNGIVDGLEPSMKTQIEVVDFPLPTKEELIELLDKFIVSGKKIIKDADFNYSKEDVAEMARSLQGLSFLEAQRAINECLINEKKLSINRLLEKKRCLVRQDDILEVIWNPPSINEVGGLDNLKEFAHMYRGQFSEEAEKFGIEPLRGMLLVGIPGTGKSLTAKVISNLWNLPCLRLDVGKVMAGIVGQSEMRMRQVIKTLEAAAPCILWCDEVEKQMSGTGSSDRSDAGTLARVFGTLLTAMEEGMKGVVTVATANDVAALPPEFIRRFDEMFFVDMPTPKERMEIFEVHLAKRKRDPKKLKLDLDLLVEKTQAFVGSEIEKMVKQAIALAWKEKKKDVDTQCFLSVIADMKPLSSTMREKIQATRDWAKGRARRANKGEEEEKKCRATSSIDQTPDLLDQLVSTSGKN